MTDAILERLHAVAAGYEAGQKMLADLDARRASVSQTMFRIEGAIQALNELSRQGAGTNDSPRAPVHGPQLGW
jgi:hypothetical protein